MHRTRSSPERGTAEADKRDAAYRNSGLVGPLHGIAIVVKDEIDAAGMPTTLGTVVFKDYRPPRDAFVVDRLRKAGAIILGKTTLSEYAAGDTYGSMFGITRNPYDLERTVGGSSGGSGAALAANFSTVALGEETLASIRRPAAWNAVVSLRPTPGLVSRSGMWDGYPSPVAQMGPMARTVADLVKLLDVMVAYDPEDPVTALGVGKTEASYSRFLDKKGLRGARIGVLRESIGVQSEPGSEDFRKVDAAFEKNIAELKAAGAVLIDPIVMPDIKALLAKRTANPDVADQALRLYLARNPGSPIKTRQDIANSPDIDKSFPPTKATQWKNPPPAMDAAKYAEFLQAREELMFNILKVMADGRLDAIVHKSVEHQPTLIKDGINPPYASNRGVPTLNTFVVYRSNLDDRAGGDLPPTIYRWESRSSAGPMVNPPCSSWPIPTSRRRIIAGRPRPPRPCRKPRLRFFRRNGGSRTKSSASSGRQCHGFAKRLLHNGPIKPTAEVFRVATAVTNQIVSKQREAMPWTRQRLLNGPVWGGCPRPLFARWRFGATQGHHPSHPNPHRRFAACESGSNPGREVQNAI